MILEWLEARLTPASRLARQFGFVYQSVALKHRYKRCARSWAPHIENCRQEIRAACQKLQQHQHLIILGSAHLHEVPRDILEKQFRRVTLIDMVHPLAVRRWAKKFAHIHLVEQDLSGFLNRLPGLADSEELLKALAQNENPFYFEADLIISSNLISQLHLTALACLARKKILASEDFQDRLGQAFSQQHLTALEQCRGSILLYGDRETIYRDRHREITYRGHFKVNMQAFHFRKKWTWCIAPLGEFSSSESIEMVVEAYTRP